MRIREQLADDVVVLGIRDKAMGGEDYEALRGIIKRHIENGVKRFVWDFSGLYWVNSSGMGIFVSGWHTIKQSGGALTVVIPIDTKNGERIDNIFNVTQVKLIFATFPDLETAIAAVRAAKVY